MLGGQPRRLVHEGAHQRHAPTLLQTHRIFGDIEIGIGDKDATKAPVVAEFARVLTPGGRMALTVWNSPEHSPLFGLAPEAVQDVILGHCYPSSEAPAIGRVVALDSGLPVTVPGMQVDRRCGSGLQAVIQACLQVGNGDHDVVVAGGCESMSNVAFYSTDMRWGGARGGVRVHDGLARGRTTAGGRHLPYGQ